MRKLLVVIGTLATGYWLLVIGNQFSIFNFQFSIPASAAVEIPDYSGRPPNEHPILAPCSRFDDRYDHLGFRTSSIKEWADRYHNQVDRVVTEYMQQRKFICSAENYRQLLEPGIELTTLAATLPTWNDPNIPLSRLDTARVLLEYLRIYECALQEFDGQRYYQTAQEEYDRRGAIHFSNFYFSDLITEVLPREQIINHERAIARKTLHRVLTLIGAFDRLSPLEAELECLQRYSLDVRNLTALHAEANACFPRTWNARDVLRDTADAP